MTTHELAIATLNLENGERIDLLPELVAEAPRLDVLLLQEGREWDRRGQKHRFRAESLLAPPGAPRPGGPATPTGQATVWTVIVQPAGTQPNVLLIVPAQPEPPPGAATVPVPGTFPPGLPVLLLPGVPAVTVQPGV